MKVCTACQRTLPLDCFGPRRGVSGGHYKCRECCAEYSRNYYRNNPDKAQTHNRKMRAKRYGLTVEQVIEFENAVCQICGDKATVVDHCHKEGSVRGALCDLCNRGLGFFRDNPELLQSAIKYLSLETSP